MRFYVTQQTSPGPLRHLFCPKHIAVGPLCGRTGVQTGFDESTPVCPDCQDVKDTTGALCCGYPGEFHSSPLGERVIRGA